MPAYRGLRFFQSLNKHEKQFLRAQNKLSTNKLVNVSLETDFSKAKKRLYLTRAEVIRQCQISIHYCAHRGVWLFRDPFNFKLHGQYKFVYVDGFLFAYQRTLTYLDKWVKHATLGSGCPVEMAGVIDFEDGKMCAISNESGHYPSTTAQFLKFIRLLCDVLTGLLSGCNDDTVKSHGKS